MGPFASRPNDTFGLGVSYLGISPAKRRFGRDVVAFTGSGSPYTANETVLEATYLFQLAPWLTLQPDLQVVINLAPASQAPPVPRAEKRPHHRSADRDRVLTCRAGAVTADSGPR